MNILTVCDTRGEVRKYGNLKDFDLIEERFTTKDDVDDLLLLLQNFGSPSFIEYKSLDRTNILERKPNLVFNLVEGSRGNYSNSLAPSFFDDIGIKYVGFDPLTSCLCQDKHSAKTLLSLNKLPTPLSSLCNNEKEAIDTTSKLSYPIFLKPNYLKKGIGLSEASIVDNEDNLLEVFFGMKQLFGGPILIEEYIKGIDLFVLVVGNTVFPPVAITSPSKVMDVRVQEDLKKVCFPFQPSGGRADKIQEKIRYVASSAYSTLGCTAAAIIDFRLGVDSIPYVLGVNRVDSYSLSSPLGIACQIYETDRRSILNVLINLSGASNERSF